MSKKKHSDTKGCELQKFHESLFNLATIVMQSDTVGIIRDCKSFYLTFAMKI